VLGVSDVELHGSRAKLSAFVSEHHVFDAKSARASSRDLSRCFSNNCLALQCNS
jgi:hypothetical protein